MDTGLNSSTTPFTPPTTEDDRLSWLRLIRSRRVGPATFHRLLAEHGSAAAALAALPGIAASAGLRDYEPCPEAVARAEMTAGRRARLGMICWGTAEYPSELADLPDAPPVLWLRGDPAHLFRPMVALVGARNASSLGLRMAARLARELGQAGLTVVSGLARGIDTAAHEAALPTGTVAVMAGGTDVIYPTENSALAARLAAEGALISEQPPGHEPQARHFPIRNRIISGLSLGVVVVEAAERSGSLITARNALDQGREVLAVPGHPVDARAGGCNLLIRDGCTLVRSAADVLEALEQPLAHARATRAGRAPPSPRPADGVTARLARTARGLLSPRAGGEATTGAQYPPPGNTCSSPTSGDIGTRPTSGPPPAAGGGSLRVFNDGPRATPGNGTDPAFGPQPPPRHPTGGTTPPPGPPERSATEIRRLHQVILDRLGPAPLAEDQLLRDLALPPARLTPELLTLELDGRITRHPGGLISRSAG